MSVLLTYDTMWTSLWSSSNDCYNIIQIILIAYETLGHTYLAVKWDLSPSLHCCVSGILWMCISISGTEIANTWSEDLYRDYSLAIEKLYDKCWKCVYVFFIYRQGFQPQSFWSVSCSVLGPLPAYITVWYIVSIVMMFMYMMMKLFFVAYISYVIKRFM